MFREEDTASVAVFSHPNHELAIFGLLQRLRPEIVYLSDGGGEERVEQTRQGLKSIDLLERAHFLNYREKSFYQALLDRDRAFYEAVSDRLCALFQNMRPAQILCDAIEFYNPVHDMSLPIVRDAARRTSANARIFEVPLVHQRPTQGETYELQRMSAPRRGEQIELRLSQPELAAKLRARDQIYTLLLDQMGALLSAVPPAHFAIEVVAPACASLPEPGGENVLRYERRAQILLERGEILRNISYAGHYLPMAAALFDS